MTIFYLPNRSETRGIGGLSLMILMRGGFESSFDFIKSVGDHFLKAYAPIVTKRKDLPFGEGSA